MSSGWTFLIMKVSSYIFFAPKRGKFLSNYDQKKINNHPIFYSWKNKVKIVYNLLFINCLTKIIAITLSHLNEWMNTHPNLILQYSRYGRLTWQGIIIMIIWGEWPGGAGWWIMALCGGIRIHLAAKHAKTNLIMGTVFRSKLGLISLIKHEKIFDIT